MQKLSNVEAELKKSVAYKAACISPLHWYVIEKTESTYSTSLDLPESKLGQIIPDHPAKIKISPNKTSKYLHLN